MASVGDKAGPDNGTHRYTAPAMVFHWIMALGVALNLGIGWFMESLHEPSRSAVTTLHYSIGITILVLFVPRLAWRLLHKPPAQPWLRDWERRLSVTVHAALYAILLVMPLLGWGILSAHPPPGSQGAQYQAIQKAAAAGQHMSPAAAASRFGSPRPHLIWWAAPLPSLSPVEKIGAEPSGLKRQASVHEALVRAHTAGAVVLGTLLILHLSGAFKHEIADRRPSLQRMGLPRLGRASRSPVGRS